VAALRGAVPEVSCRATPSARGSPARGAEGPSIVGRCARHGRCARTGDAVGIAARRSRERTERQLDIALVVHAASFASGRAACRAAAPADARGTWPAPGPERREQAFMLVVGFRSVNLWVIFPSDRAHHARQPDAARRSESSAPRRDRMNLWLGASRRTSRSVETAAFTGFWRVQTCRLEFGSRKRWPSNNSVDFSPRHR
jgi:hypothetical protein